MLISSSEVRYRENAASCNIDTLGAGQEASAQAVSPSSAPSASVSTTFDDGSYTWSELPTPTTAAVPKDCSIGFIGLFFSTFFGGHSADWSPSADQYTYFKEFAMWNNGA